MFSGFVSLGGFCAVAHARARSRVEAASWLLMEPLLLDLIHVKTSLFASDVTCVARAHSRVGK